MIEQPLVSVIIPVFNREYCVGEAIESVLAQTHRAVECLVVDDGSTDGSVAIIEAAAARDPRVRMFAGAHAGVSAARNIALEHATGEYVTFLDSDDLMVDVRIERQLAHLLDTGVGVVICHQRCELVGGAPLPEVYERRPMWWGGPYPMSVLVATPTARATGGFDESLELGEDVEFYARLVANGEPVGIVEDVLLVRRFFGDNASYRIDDEFGVMVDSIRRHRARGKRTGERLGFE